MLRGGVALGITILVVWVGAAAVFTGVLDVRTVVGSSSGVASIGIVEQNIQAASLDEVMDSLC